MLKRYLLIVQLIQRKTQSSGCCRKDCGQRSLSVIMRDFYPHVQGSLMNLECQKYQKATLINLAGQLFTLRAIMADTISSNI